MKIREWSGTLNTDRHVSCQEAKEMCAALGEGWRLPTISELLSLVDGSRQEPAIDTDSHPDTWSCEYWTMSPATKHGGADSQWAVDFIDGSARRLPPSSGGAVRAVRAVASMP